MKASALVVGFLVMLLAGNARPQAAPDTERRDLMIATQQAAGSPVDFVRALEAHLRKYPNSPYRERIVRSLFEASKKLDDQRRVALYGEQLLAKDPNDVSVLAAVGSALNASGEKNASRRALQIGQQLEKDVRGSADAKPKLERAHDLGLALAIEADAYGNSGRTHEAVSAAKDAFAAFPSAEAARSLGRWEASAGDNDAAVTAYADAFALGDSAEHHADDRRNLTELYRKDHKNATGLGDIVLAEYDRMIALQEELEPGTSTASPVHLANASIAEINGKQVPLATFKGKVLVMDFWATWCQPCRMQHPLFESVKSSFKDDPRVVFLEVNAGEDRATVEPFLKKQAWSGDAYLDNDLTHILNIENIPATVLLDPNSNVYSEMIGFRPETFAALLTSRIQDALAAPPRVN